MFPYFCSAIIRIKHHRLGTVTSKKHTNSDKLRHWNVDLRDSFKRKDWWSPRPKRCSMELPSVKRRLFLTTRFWMGSLSIEKQQKCTVWWEPRLTMSRALRVFPKIPILKTQQVLFGQMVNLPFFGVGTLPPPPNEHFPWQSFTVDGSVTFC